MSNKCSELPRSLTPPKRVKVITWRSPPWSHHRCSCEDECLRTYLYPPVIDYAASHMSSTAMLSIGRCCSPAFQEVSNSAIWCHFIPDAVRGDLLKERLVFERDDEIMRMKDLPYA